ncbi:MAG: MEDS domain-containing protein [Candidatus Bathyarchaeota archaeon]|nr:MEDS domain-containing protein [Candidatus Bathyarchaeota archaeon]
MEEKALDHIRRMKPRDHCMLFYESRKHKQLILFTFLKAGLDKGEAAIYVAGEESPRRIKKAMKDFGLDVEKYTRTDSLNIVDYRNWYIIDGEFDIERTKGLWMKSLNEAITKGFKGLRVVGEMACFLKHEMTEELIEYEKALHSVLEIPLTAICAYNTDIMNKAVEEESYYNLYFDLIESHKKFLSTSSEENDIQFNYWDNRGF